HERVHEAFVERFAARMSSFAMGAGLDGGATLGPLVSERERDRVAALVDEALARGATARCGGRPGDGRGWFYPATVLDPVDPGDPILRTEVFGPVAPIVTFGDGDDVVAMANTTEDGLAAYVYSRDLARALRTAEGLQTGMVGIN